MRSPKFSYILDDLLSCITTQAVSTVWRKSIGAQLRKQLIFDLVEFRDYSRNLNQVATELIAEISTGEYRTSPTKHYLVEKSRGLCRQMTIGAPRDLIVLQCLSTHLHGQIKSSQPTKTAFFEPGEGEFAKNRILIRPNDYGSYSSWKRFQNAVFNFSKEHEFIVVTDIANFYDFINFSHLRNIISSICATSEGLVDFLIFMLDSLAWHPDFMPTTGVGIPQMDTDAPRVLANAMLFELDRVAHDRSFGDYVRFMDDIDVGVDSIPQAKAVVRDIDLTLQARQLRLNSSKTKILRTSTGEAARHFCIKENKFLDFCATFLERHPHRKKHVQKALRGAYGIWRGGDRFQNSRFLEGNGEKIFKYLCSLLRHVDDNLPEDDILWLIQHVPGLRKTCFSLLARHPYPNRAFYKLLEMFRRGVFVDDASYSMMSNFALHALFVRNSKFEDAIRYLISLFVETKEYFKIYSAIVVASKFLIPSEILSIVRISRPFWERDLWMGRAIAGLAPVMSLDPTACRDYIQLCQSAHNNAWEAVYDYHDELQTSAEAANSASSYAKHKNPTYAHGIFYPKVLIILSIFLNTETKPLAASILAKHPILLKDPYYKVWFDRGATGVAVAAE